MWSTILTSVSRAILHPGSATVQDYVLTVLLIGGVFYTVLFFAGVRKTET